MRKKVQYVYYYIPLNEIFVSAYKLNNHSSITMLGEL